MNINNNGIFVSVIVCCYNSERYLKETLKSIKDQTYKKWELVIINDGSKDNTEKIILDFKNINKHLSITYYKQQNLGLPYARNKALELCHFEWVGILDHDDLWKIDKLEKQIKEIRSNPKSHLFFGDLLYLKGNINPYKYTRFEGLIQRDGLDPRQLDLTKNNAYNNLIKHGCFITSSTVMFKKSTCLKLGGFNLNYKFLTDYIFFNEVSLNYDLFCSRELMCHWRMSNTQATEVMNYEYFNEMNRFYFSCYKSKRINFSIKYVIIKRHFRLMISLFFKRYIKFKDN